jgi:hypothetical protein
MNAKEKFEYITWEIQSLTNELIELGARMDDRERQQQEQEEQEQNDGR